MKCAQCLQEFTPKRSTAQFCSTGCRVKHARNVLVKDGASTFKSTSPTVALKQRTKQRILAKSGKAQGPSSTPSAGSDLPVPDVPPVSDSVAWPGLTDEVVAKIKKSHLAPKGLTALLPVEHHGKTNDLARQSILSKVPAPKQDPNSDAATLARLNAVQKSKKKGEAES